MKEVYLNRSRKVLSLMESEKIYSDSANNPTQQIREVSQPLSMTGGYPMPAITASVANTLCGYGLCQDLSQRFVLEYCLKFKEQKLSLVFLSSGRFTGDNHVFVVVGDNKIADNFLSGRGSTEAQIDPTVRITLKQFIKQNDQIVYADPLLNFVSDGSDLSQLTQYCEQHSLRHVVAVRNYALTPGLIQQAPLIKKNATIIATKIKQNLGLLPKTPIYQNAQTSQNEFTEKELDENILFVHQTNILPANGVIIPGKIIPNNNTQIDERTKRQQFLNHVPNIRMTIHWFVNELVTQHESYTKSGKYIIIEHAKYLRPYLYGGYVEDFFSVGPYRLSPKAIIIAPSAEFHQVQQELEGFAGKILFYSPEVSVSLVDFVKSIITKNSKWDIHTDQNQTIVKQYPTKVFYQHLQQQIKSGTINLLDEYNERIYGIVQKADENKQETVELEANCTAEQTTMRCNGKIYSVHDFFYSWYRSGLYFGHHFGSVFGDFEAAAQNLLIPFQVLLDNPDETSFDDAVLPNGMPVVRPYQELEQLLQTTRKLLQKIKQQLTERQMPEQVMSYFKDEWEINFDIYWLSIIEDDIAAAKANNPRILFNCQAIEERISDIRGNIRSHSGQYEVKLPEKQTTTIYLTQKLGLPFKTMKQKNSNYVDAVSELEPLQAENRQQRQQLVERLTTNNIPFVFFPNPAQPEYFIVPKVNTEEVADAVASLAKT